MSRLYRSFQALFGPAGMASRLQSGQTVRIERVKIRKGKPTTRFLGTVIKGAIVFQLVMWAIPAPRTRQEGDGGHKEEEGEPRFIPFPLTTVRHPPQPYAGSDPEWREFVRISRDRAAQHEMRDHIANLALTAVRTNPVLGMMYGQDAQIRKYWLDIDFPYRAPPLYERSGILITDEALEWAAMPCDPSIARSLALVLWPKPVALGLWAFGTAMVKEQARQVAGYFGFASEDPNSAQARPNPGPPSPLPSSPSPEVRKALERIRQGTTRRPEEVDDPSSMPSSAGAAPHGKAMGVPDKPAANQSGPSEKETVEREHRGLQLPLGDTVSQPWKKLREAYARERSALRPDPVRGSLLVSGLVEVQTTHACIVVDVWGWYDPKTRSHSPGTVRLRVRRVQRKVQRPVQK